MIVIRACQWSGDAIYTASRSFSSSKRRKSLKSRGFPPDHRCRHVPAGWSPHRTMPWTGPVSCTGPRLPPGSPREQPSGPDGQAGGRNRRPRPPRPMCPMFRRSLGAGVASTDAGTMVIPSDVEAAPERKVLRVTRSLLFMLVSAIAAHSTEAPSEGRQLPTESGPATAVNLSATKRLERLGHRKLGSRPAGQGGTGSGRVCRAGQGCRGVRGRACQRPGAASHRGNRGALSPESGRGALPPRRNGLRRTSDRIEICRHGPDGRAGASGSGRRLLYSVATYTSGVRTWELPEYGGRLLLWSSAHF